MILILRYKLGNCKEGDKHELMKTSQTYRFCLLETHSLLGIRTKSNKVICKYILGCMEVENMFKYQPNLNKLVAFKSNTYNFFPVLLKKLY